MSYKRRMRVYQTTDTDRRANPTTCGGDSVLETTFTMDPDGSGEPYQELTVRLNASGGFVMVSIDTVQCKKKVSILIDGEFYEKPE